jgi:phage protein D/phage baseplate assembly protein gpV
MAVSPLNDADGPVRLTLTSDGHAVADALQVVSVTVRRGLNRVPSATLVIADGDMPEQTFPVSDGAEFQPGAKIAIQAGYGDKAETIFQGIVVQQALRISGNNDAHLVVKCADLAVKMTVARRHAQYRDMTDAEALCLLLDRFNPGAADHANVKGASLWHETLVQHHCTDWDFLLARAEANGCVVVVQDGSVTVGPPETSGTADLTVAYGDSLISFDAQLDAWAQAQQLQSGLQRLRGTMRFQGSARARVGGLIDLKGVGTRFSGSVYVSALTHEIADGNWFTQVEFGMPPWGAAQDPGMTAPAAAGLVPGIQGLQVGVVTQLEGDPAKQCRIQVRVPAAGVDGLWARLLQVHASSGAGAVFLPELGDEVLLGWFDNDPAHAVVLGSLYSSQHLPPQAWTDQNAIKAIVTRCKARLEFNDEDKSITLETPGRNKVVINDKTQSVAVTDQHGNRVVLGPDGIRLDSVKDIQISAQGSVRIAAGGALQLGAQAEASLQGLNVRCEAQVGLVAKGAASAELSAAGQTTVKGAMVLIN